MRRTWSWLVQAVLLALTAVAAFPAMVAADCNGNGCGETIEPPVEGLQAVLLIVLLAVFATVLALGEARRR